MHTSAKASGCACQTGRWIRRNAAEINPPDKPDRPTSIFRRRLRLFSSFRSVGSLPSLTHSAYLNSISYLLLLSQKVAIILFRSERRGGERGWERGFN